MNELEENYHSREGALNLIYEDSERVQYDGEDEERIKKVAEDLTLSTMSLISAMGSYRDAIALDVDEDTPSIVRAARAELIEAWAYNQLALSRVGWAIRVDGNEAYAKLINSQLNPLKPLNFTGM